MELSESIMSASAFARDVINKIPEVESSPLAGNKVELVVPKEKLRDVVELLDSAIDDAFPESVFGVDLENDQYELVYIFWSHKNRLLVQIRVRLEGNEASIDSVCNIFPGLEWHERETHEMFGINFMGHPDLRLLLLPDELEGKYPLRKSFKTDRSRLDETGLTTPKSRAASGGDDE
ncbi:MAG: NADH-quinone oxidoreductase subunit C [Candidatus Thorarchaeota archaeon]|nr:NADH-quinone oxidoreductase subunit C [Candidatus Thorarchaeota archaeon]